MATRKEVGYAHSASIVTAPDGLSDEVETFEVRYYVWSNGKAEIVRSHGSWGSDVTTVEVETLSIGHWQYIPNSGGSYGGQAIGYKDPVPSGTGFGSNRR